MYHLFVNSAMNRHFGANTDLLSTIVGYQAWGHLYLTCRTADATLTLTISVSRSLDFYQAVVIHALRLSERSIEDEDAFFYTPPVERFV
jgi:hypothetical protein